MAALSIAAAAAKRYFCGMTQRRLDPERIRPALLMSGLLLLLLAACHANADKSDEHRHDGLYGGVSGGVTRLP
jgi:hypothetical protein